jgi:hypothetical protein
MKCTPRPQVRLRYWPTGIEDGEMSYVTKRQCKLLARDMGQSLATPREGAFGAALAHNSFHHCLPIHESRFVRYVVKRTGEKG